MMMMDFLRSKKKKAKKYFCDLIWVTKTINKINMKSLLELAKKLNRSCRNCMKIKEELEEAIKDTIKEYKEIIFDSDTPVCMAYLDKLKKQQTIDQHISDQWLMDDMIRKLAWDGLQKNIAMDGDTMIDKKTGEALSPEVDSTYGKEDKF